MVDRLPTSLRLRAHGSPTHCGGCPGDCGPRKRNYWQVGEACGTRGRGIRSSGVPAVDARRPAQCARMSPRSRRLRLVRSRIRHADRREPAQAKLAGIATAARLACRGWVVARHREAIVNTETKTCLDDLRLGHADQRRVDGEMLPALHAALVARLAIRSYASTYSGRQSG